MKNNLTILTVSLIAIASFQYTGCGEDSTTNNNTGSSKPNIDIKVGAMYQFTNDTIPRSGPDTTRRTSILTFDSVWNKGVWYGYSNSWQIGNVNKDTSGVVISRDTLYVSYDSSGGKFYQWGLIKYIDPSQQAAWNIVADFSLAQGTQYQITTFTFYGYPVDVKGKVASDTVIQTTAIPSVTVRCYRIEITATPTGLYPIYIDYYLGYSPANLLTNPSGPVRVRLRRFSIFGAPYPGFDQILQYARIP